MGIKVDRKTLKGYFRKGATPKGEEFENLIESILNFEDDDIVHFEDEHSPVFIKKAEKNGGTILEVYQKQEGSALAVLQWKIDLDSKGKLSVKPKDSTDGIIELSPSKEIKIRGDVSVDKLTVTGEFIAEKGISVKGDFTAEKGMTVKGNLSAENKLTVKGELIAEKEISVKGDFTAEKGMTVKGVLSAEKGMILKGNLEIDGNLNFTNGIQSDIITIKPGSTTIFTWPSISDLDVFEIKVIAPDYFYRALIWIETENKSRKMKVVNVDIKEHAKRGIRSGDFRLVMLNLLGDPFECGVSITKFK